MAQMGLYISSTLEALLNIVLTPWSLTANRVTLFLYFNLSTPMAQIYTVKQSVRALHHFLLTLNCRLSLAVGILCPLSLRSLPALTAPEEWTLLIREIFFLPLILENWSHGIGWIERSKQWERVPTQRAFGRFLFLYSEGREYSAFTFRLRFT